MNILFLMCKLKKNDAKQFFKNIKSGIDYSLKTHISSFGKCFQKTFDTWAVTVL